MKILRFHDDRIGILVGDNRVADVSEAIANRVDKGPQRVIEEVIEHFADYRGEFSRIAASQETLDLASIPLLAPVPRPSKCLAAFVNYIDRPGRSIDTLPNEYFYKAPEIIGSGGRVELVDIPPVVVYQPEAELGFVMGKRAKNVNETDAMDYVFGYVSFVDISARGMTRPTTFLSKGQDTHALCGPWIVTKDEVPDPHNLMVRSWVNGEARQDYSTKFMAHSIPDQIAWLTRFVQLQPGDIIATGTYHEGLGPLNPGDALEIAIDEMGLGKYFISGSSPRKDVEWMPGISQPVPPAAGKWTKV